VPARPGIAGTLRQRPTGLRLLVCGLVLALGATSAAPAFAQSFRAGVTRITVQDAEPFDAVIVYPTDAAEGTVEAGGFKLAASRDASLASGRLLPLVLFSHGSGRGPGTPLVHRELLLHLARDGFIVVAPSHPGTRQPLVDRPRQIRMALATTLADPRFAPRADHARIGMMGFSFGGAVTLLAAGAMSNLAHLSAYCGAHRDDPRACEGIPTDGSLAGIPARKSADALALKALVLLEPFGALFDRAGLAALDMPILIYHALQTDLRLDGNALAIARALPRQPQSRAAPGGHFVFVDPCTPLQTTQAPQLCTDPPGVDRAAIHQRLRREVADFFRASL
jgi:predicted dienelactone hydrolase